MSDRCVLSKPNPVVVCKLGEESSAGYKMVGRGVEKEAEMNIRRRLHNYSLIRYTGGKEDKYMKKHRCDMARILKGAGIMLMLAVFCTMPLAQRVLGNQRGLTTIEKFIVYLDTDIDYEALNAFVAGLTQEEARDARQAFLEDPRGELEQAGISLSPKLYIMVLNLEMGEELGVFRVSSSRDEREAAPPGIGLMVGRLGVGIQRAIDEPFEGSIIDELFGLLIELRDEDLERLDLALGVLEGKPVDSVDRVDFRDEAMSTLRNEWSIDIDRLYYRVEVFDLPAADVFQNEGDEEDRLLLYNESGPAEDLPLREEFIGFFYPKKIAVLFRLPL